MVHNFLISRLESLNEPFVAGEKRVLLEADNDGHAPTS